MQQSGNGTSPEISDAMLAVFRTVVSDRTAIYCSTPITSGRRFFAWMDRLGLDCGDVDSALEIHGVSHAEAVVRPNVMRAAEVCNDVSVQTGKIVINPSSLQIAIPWRQSDWRSFWGRVIEHFAEYVVLLDDWEFSNGCVYEYLIAVQNGIPTVDERLTRISISEGRKRVQDAIREISRRHGQTQLLLSLLVQLDIELTQRSPEQGVSHAL